jgi:hypothetical protein
VAPTVVEVVEAGELGVGMRAVVGHAGYPGIRRGKVSRRAALLPGSQPGRVRGRTIVGEAVLRQPEPATRG